MSESDSVSGVESPLFMAGMHLLRRTGALSVGIRYQNDDEPTVWIVVAGYSVNEQGRPAAKGGKPAHQVGAGLTPLTAMSSVLERAIDGGLCLHCGRPSGVTDQWQSTMPLADVVCWYVFDPETSRYRRSCEGS